MALFKCDIQFTSHNVLTKVFNCEYMTNRYDKERHKQLKWLSDTTWATFSPFIETGRHAMMF